MRASALVAQFRVLSLESRRKLEKFDPAKIAVAAEKFQFRKGKKKEEEKKLQPEPQTIEELGNSCLEKMLVLCVDVRSTFDKLVTTCRESNSNKSLLAILQQYIESLYFLISLTKKVVSVRKLPDDVTSSNKKMMPEWLETMKTALKAIEILAPSSDTYENCDKIVQSAEKCLRSEFYEEVTKEEKRQIFEAMSNDVGSGVGNFGGHWYTCPNGHVYTIGECGGAMQESKCPECGQSVGGHNHHRVARNNVATEFLQEVGGLQHGHVQ